MVGGWQWFGSARDVANLWPNIGLMEVAVLVVFGNFVGVFFLKEGDRVRELFPFSCFPFWLLVCSSPQPRPPPHPKNPTVSCTNGFATTSVRKSQVVVVVFQRVV